MKGMSAGILITALAALVSPILAQVRTEVAIDRARIQSDRQAIVAGNLPLTEEQAKAFWPVYREYREEIQKLGDRLMEIMLGFGESYENLSDDQATKLLDEYMVLMQKEIKVKADWIPKFREILPTKTVTRFCQIENKLDAILRFESVDLIPLVKTDTE